MYPTVLWEGWKDSTQNYYVPPKCSSTNTFRFGLCKCVRNIIALTAISFNEWIAF